VFVAGELRGDIRHGAFAFDQKLSGDSEFFREPLHQIVVLVAFVDIDHDSDVPKINSFPAHRTDAHTTKSKESYQPNDHFDIQWFAILQHLSHSKTQVTNQH
jgi:hypothetical protein